MDNNSSSVARLSNFLMPFWLLRLVAPQLHFRVAHILIDFVLLLRVDHDLGPIASRSSSLEVYMNVSRE